MRKHSIHSPSNLEIVVQLAKQCWKEGQDFPEERLPIPRAGDSKGRPQTWKITDYHVGGGFHPHARGTTAYSRVQRAELVDRDGLPPLCHCRHACISSHVMCVGPASPRSRPKECDESGMHTHLLFATFQVNFVSPYFLVAHAAGATIEITRLYNSGVERLKNEEDWARVRPTFTCDLWKSATNKEYFTCTAH